jgi:hypothetical protein
MPLYWLCSRHNNQISVVIEPWAPHHFRGLFSSITPHAAAAVIPPSAMSTKTSSGVPRVIILATLVVLATSVAVVPHVGVRRCDGHHKMVDLYWTRLAKDLFVCANDLLIETTAANCH